ncbi:MAG: hypothetical protein Q27BB25_14795 [Blastomonas sp. CACIA14H2]|uniref:hypothetical protein n=1 Tax=Blastomonas sp. CACIA14H2 TaxID=1419876 RepID=UPI0003D06EF7|nr:MAG: hypothetical protein Q27BB25_14795 [Blastomonas sp. CACIA14H2]
MSRRQHICDVPGCTHTRQRWQRLCLVCYGELPREVRNNLIRAHAEKRMADWRSWKRKAGEIIAARRAARAPSTRWTPQNAFDLHARMLGERTD